MLHVTYKDRETGALETYGLDIRRNIKNTRIVDSAHLSLNFTLGPDTIVKFNSAFAASGAVPAGINFPLGITLENFLSLNIPFKVMVVSRLIDSFAAHLQGPDCSRGDLMRRIDREMDKFQIASEVSRFYAELYGENFYYLG